MGARPIAIVSLIIGAHYASAKIGETAAQVQQRYGTPIKEALDANGSGMRLYRNDTFKEIRIAFEKGISRKEVFKCEQQASEGLIAMMRDENPGQNVFAVGDSMTVDADE